MGVVVTRKCLCFHMDTTRYVVSGCFAERGPGCCLMERLVPTLEIGLEGHLMCCGWGR